MLPISFPNLWSVISWCSPLCRAPQILLLRFLNIFIKAMCPGRRRQSMRSRGNISPSSPRYSLTPTCATRPQPSWAALSPCCAHIATPLSRLPARKRFLPKESLCLRPSCNVCFCRAVSSRCFCRLSTICAPSTAESPTWRTSSRTLAV